MFLFFAFCFRLDLFFEALDVIFYVLFCSLYSFWFSSDYKDWLVSDILSVYVYLVFCFRFHDFLSSLSDDYCCCSSFVYFYSFYCWVGLCFLFVCFVLFFLFCVVEGDYYFFVFYFRHSVLVGVHDCLYYNICRDFCWRLLLGGFRLFLSGVRILRISSVGQFCWGTLFLGMCWIWWSLFHGCVCWLCTWVVSGLLCTWFNLSLVFLLLPDIR